MEMLIELLKKTSTTTTTETHDGNLHLKTTGFIKVDGQAQKVELSAVVPWSLIESMVPEPNVAQS